MPQAHSSTLLADAPRDARFRAAGRMEAAGAGARAFVGLTIGAILVADLVWCRRIGLAVGGWWGTLGAVIGLLALSAAYRRRSRRIADTAEAGALWVGFSAAGCVLTYLAATCAWPLQDAAFARADRALGFDWPAWYGIVASTPTLRWALRLAYESLLPQIVLAILVLPLLGLAGRGIALVGLAAIALLVTTLISAVAPALGAVATFGGDPPAYLPDLLALRAAGPWRFDLVAMQGIIQMPSYHAVLAVLFTHAFRRTGWLGWCIAGLNGLMLASAPPFGGHYLVDVLAGCAIALLCILAWRGVARITPG